MLINLTEDVIRAAVNGQNDIIRAIEHIALSSFRGYHIMHSSRAGYEELLNADVSVKTKAIIKKRLKNYALEGNVLSYFTFIAEISEEENIQKITKSGKTIIRIPAKLFELSAGPTSPTFILCENTDDIPFYQFACDIYKHDQKLDITIPYMYEPMQGGGDTLHKVFKYHLKKNERFCFCIVDSDKLHPSFAIGQTAKKAIDAYTENPSDMCCIYSLKFSREIENLIPLVVLEKICEKCCTWKQSLDIFKNLKDLDENLLLYGDLKKGLRKKKYPSLKSTELGNTLAGALVNLGLSTHEALKTCNKDTKGVFFCGMGDDMLLRSTEYINEHKNTEEYFNSLLPNQKKELLAIGKRFFNFTCAPIPIRS